MAPKSKEMDNTMSLKIPSILENLRIIESFIDHAREYFQFDDDIYGNILIAVTESVNNAIIHGNKQDKDKNIHLELKVTKAHIRFTVEDEGDGFDYDSLPDPTSPNNIDTDGGRGIFLVKHLTDEVKFLDEGRKMVLTFYMNQ